MILFLLISRRWCLRNFILPILWGGWLLANSNVAAAYVGESVLQSTSCPVSEMSPLRLMDVVIISLCSSSATKAAWLLTQSQNSSYDGAQSRYWPTVRLSNSLGITQGFDKAYESKRSSDVRTNDLSIEAEWIIYDSGHREAQSTKAYWLLQQAKVNHDTEVLEVFYNAARIYRRTQAAQSTLKAIEGAEALIRDVLTMVIERQEGGIASSFDELITNVSLSELQLRKIQVSADVDLHCYSLNSALGRPVESACVLEDFDNAGEKMSLRLSEITNLVNNYNPKILAAKASVQTHSAHLSVVKKQHGATVTLFGSVAYQNTLQSKTETNTIGLKLTYPLFDQSLKRSERNAASYLAQSSAETLEDTSRAVLEEVQIKYKLISSREEALMLAEKNINTMTNLLKMAGERYQVGLSNIADYIELHKNVMSAEEQYIRLLERYSLVYLDLLESTGTLDRSVLGQWL